jgi:OmpA-OmpF porin, OOP family
MKIPLGLAMASLFVSLATPPALAQTLTPFDLDRPILTSDAARFLGANGGKLLEPGQFRLSLAGHYQHDPLVLYRGDDALGSLVSSRVQAMLQGSMRLHRRFQVGFSLPVIVSQEGESLSNYGLDKPGSSGLAAPSVDLRVGLLQQSFGDPVDLSFDLAGILPVGSKSALARDDGASLRAGLGLGLRQGKLEMGVDTSVWIRPETDIGNDAAAGKQLLFAAGIGNAGPGIRLEAVVRGMFGLSALGNGVEAHAGIRIPTSPWIELFALGGPGFGTTAGTPQLRILAGLALLKPTEKKPPRKVATEDPCKRKSATIAECPLADFDGDGIANRKDNCPTDAEDKDEFEDKNGCPDLDNDEDGILDTEDKCPLKKGTERFEGCPPPDQDGDGIVDPDDQCPTEPGLKERDGCPLRDTDGDGSMDDVDNCINEVGPADNQGCPKKQKQLVKITKDKLVILDKVYFDTNKATIQSRSFKLLDQVAQVLNDHTEVKRVRVEGHTDDQGNDAHNLKLSQDRADAVSIYLMANGVAPERLTAVGFGETQPLESNKTKKGRATNRRVEFVIASEEP